MNCKRMILFGAGLILGATGIAEAQQAMTGPPPVLVIGREVVKPGKGPAHQKWETGWPRLMAKTKWPVHYLAMTSLTGENRVLFFTGYGSMADWEKDQQNQDKNASFTAENDALNDKDGEFLKESRTGVFTYMPDLSYQAAVPIATMRYFTIVSILVKPGHGDHFAEVRKMVKAAHEKANLVDHYAVYHMVSGGSPGHYLILIPMQSLKEADDFPAVHGKAYKDALGEEGQKKLEEFSSHGVESSETNLFAFSPKMSYVAKEWIEADPDFWAPKPKAAAKPTAKKEAPKKP
jgi:hypothetical protein